MINIENLKKSGLFDIFKEMYNNKYENAKDLIKANKNIILFQDVNIMLPKSLRSLSFNVSLPMMNVSYLDVKDLVEQEINEEKAKQEQEELNKIIALTTTESKKINRL